MTQKEKEAYVSAAFGALVEKGIAKPEQLCPSHVTDEEEAPDYSRFME